MLIFELPSKEELNEMGREERMNTFRRYFASSRYNRLLIQQTLVRTALDQSLCPEMERLEKIHNEDFFKTVERMREHGYFEEFMAGVKEEDEALTKIIEAYDKRMNR